MWSRSGFLEVVAEALRARRMAQLGERLRLDLADALARHAELLAHLLEGAHLTVVETEAEPDDRALAVVELLERFLDRLGEQRPRRSSSASTTDWESGNWVARRVCVDFPRASARGQP